MQNILINLRLKNYNDTNEIVNILLQIKYHRFKY